MLRVGAVAETLGCIDGRVGPVREALDTLSAVVAKVDLGVGIAASASRRQRTDLVFAVAPESRKAHGAVAEPSVPVGRLMEGEARPVRFQRMEAEVVFPELALGTIDAVQWTFGGGGRGAYGGGIYAFRVPLLRD